VGEHESVATCNRTVQSGFVETVPTALRQDLARQRRAGVEFSSAWGAAVAAALACEPVRFERDTWAVALGATWRAWASAYYRAAPPPGATACETMELL
jgi:hypothetical protein